MKTTHDNCETYSRKKAREMFRALSPKIKYIVKRPTFNGYPYDKSNNVSNSQQNNLYFGPGQT